MKSLCSCVKEFDLKCEINWPWSVKLLNLRRIVSSPLKKHIMVKQWFSKIWFPDQQLTVSPGNLLEVNATDSTLHCWLKIFGRLGAAIHVSAQGMLQAGIWEALW